MLFRSTDVFTLKQNLYKALSGYSPTGSNKNYNKLVRLAESTDTDHNNIYIYIQEYQFGGKDVDIESNLVPASVTILDVIANLDIDSMTIRTGNGQ